MDLILISHYHSQAGENYYSCYVATDLLIILVTGSVNDFVW